MKSLLTFFLVFTMLSCSVFAQRTKIKDLPIFIKSIEDKAKFYHYKAIKYDRENKTKKAISNLHKAIGLHKKNEYLIDLANLYAKIDKPKDAYNTIQKIMPKDNDPEVLKVEVLAWKSFML